MEPVDQLVAAVTSDDLSAATACLTRHPELSSRLDDSFPALPFGGTLLLAAVARGSKPMIDLLLGHGAHIDQRSRWWAGGFGVLDTADPNLADFLIDRGARLDVHAASRLGRMDALEKLLAGDPALVHARGGDGQTPLHVAASADVAAVLLDAGADMNARDVDHESTAAQYAIRDRQSVTRWLVQRGCDTDVLMACAIGDLDRVRRHLDTSPTSIAMTVSRDYFPMSNPHAGGTIYIWTLGDHKSAHAIARDFGHDSVFRLRRWQRYWHAAPRWISVTTISACRRSTGPFTDRSTATTASGGTTPQLSKRYSTPGRPHPQAIQSTRASLFAMYFGAHDPDDFASAKLQPRRSRGVGGRERDEAAPATASS